MALAHAALFLLNVSASKSARPQIPSSHLPPRHGEASSWVVPSFKTGFPLLVKLKGKNLECRSARVFSIKCEQGTKEAGGLDVWLGRLAMVGFASAITVEVVTGKGLLENFGLGTPLPSLALVATTLIGVLTAVFIFQSATGE